MPDKDKISRIGVLMPVYNAAPFLEEAIDSILNQTYKEFDFYIINDGSIDNSEAIIESYQDDRINYLKNDTNRGLVYTLNRGLNEIRNEFVVRMDSDDIAMPQRFELQIKYMDANPEVMASGTQIQYFGQSDAQPIFPLTHNELKAKLILAHGIVHPTAIYRKEFIDENKIRYEEEFYFIEDYNFWLKVSKSGRLGNISDVLLKYRWEGQNVTAKNWHTREGRYKLIYQDILRELEIEPTEINKQIHLELGFNSEKIGEISLIYNHIKLILNQNKKLRIYPQRELELELFKAWDKLFYKVADDGLLKTMRFWGLSRKITWKQLRYIIARLLKRN